MAKNGNALPKGFTPLGFERCDGYYTVEEGNVLQGIVNGSFKVTTDLGTKTVFRIKLTKGGTKVVLAETNEPGTLGVGDICGIDQRGFLKPLDSVPEGKEVFIRCTGKGVAKKGQSAPWMFDLGLAAE